VPAQDKQYLVAFAQLPNAASLDRTEAVIRQMGEIAREQPGVEVNGLSGFSGLSITGWTNSSNAGILFVNLKSFDERRDPELRADAIGAALAKKFADIQDAAVAVVSPPAVDGLGTFGGFRMQLEDHANVGFYELQRQVEDLIQKASQVPALGPLFTTYQATVPQIDLHVDREKAMAEGIDLNELAQTLQAFLGSFYVNDFNRFGRTYQVNVSAEPAFRQEPEDIVALKIRNARGEMVPLGSFVNVRQSVGPERVMHYNGYLTADINGEPAPGFSSGQAKEAMERLAAEHLPNGIGFEWTEMTYQQTLAGNTAVVVFPLCVLLVFLVLAAVYESVSLPLAVILIVPMVLFSAIAGVWVADQDNSIFTQISLIVLVGLACKNAILIVEFARELQARGMDRHQAVLEAARLRLRPILMTSIAFVMGVSPLVFSQGAGAEMRHAIGAAVFSGMLGVTFFGLLYSPLFYVLVRAWIEKRKARADAAAGQVLSPSPY
jgi:multidrug efflux pump